jgi:hypothetical protein
MMTRKDTQDYLCRALPLSNPRAWIGIVLIIGLLAALYIWGVSPVYHW